MAAPGGKRPGAGRKPGIPNKITTSMKEAFRAAFDDLQNESGETLGHLKQWATENPSDFYRICAKMIPQQINAEVTHMDKPADMTDAELINIAKSGSARTAGQTGGKKELTKIH